MFEKPTKLIERAAEAVRAVVHPATPKPPAETSVLLTPGRHVIDGNVVDVPREGDRDHVYYPLAPGRHVIDERVVIVHPLGPFIAL